MSLWRRRKRTGSIYTPHAGSMIIHVQRENTLASRTIVLSERKVRLLRFLLTRTGITVLVVLGASWIFFAIQAARVPYLTQRIESMHADVSRIDTLSSTLAALQARYQQVQQMLGVKPGVAAPAADSAMPAEARPAQPVAPITPTSSATPAEPTKPSLWPLTVNGFVTRGTSESTRYGEAHPGLDIAVPVGTQVRAAGGGLVVEVSESDEYGKYVRLTHADEYETLYAHLSRTLVSQDARVPAGSVIALSGNTGRSTAPHLHFEVRHRGTAIDPMTVMNKGNQYGDVREAKQQR